MATRSIRGGSLQWSQVRVGLLILVSLALLGYAIYRIGDLFDSFAARYEIVTLVPTGIGLLEGAPVTLAGQRVGQIRRIDFLPVGYPGPHTLSVTLSINDDVREHIRTDSRGRIRTQGLLGDRYLDIAPGTIQAPMLQSGDTLITFDALDLEDVIHTAAATLGAVEGLIEDLRTLTGGLVRGEGTIGRLLTDEALYDEMVVATAEVQRLLAQVNAAEGTLARLLHDPSLYDELSRAIGRVDALGAAILEGDGTVARLLRSDDLYENVLAVIGRADTTIIGLSDALGEITDGEGALQRLLSDPGLYDEFLKAIVDLQTLIRDIRENPKRYRPEVKIDVF